MSHLDYSDWPTDPDSRLVTASNAFGHDLAMYARDYAFDEIPADATPRERELAKKAACNALYGFMMMLDGVVVEKMKPELWRQFALILRVQRVNEEMTVVEEIELGPDGEGLCMGFHSWMDDDFGTRP